MGECPFNAKGVAVVRLQVHPCNSHSNELTWVLSTVKKGDPPPLRTIILPGRAVDKKGIQELAGVQDSRSKKQMKKFPSKAKAL